MTDLVAARPRDLLHHRNVFGAPVPVDWGDEVNARFRPVLPKDTHDSDEFTPRWLHYFPVTLRWDLDPKDAATLMHEFAPGAILVRFPDRLDMNGKKPVYGLSIKADTLDDPWPLLTAFVCCGAVPPLFLADRIAPTDIPQEDGTRRLEAVMEALLAPRLYMARTTERVALLCQAVELNVNQHRDGDADGVRDPD